MEFSMLLLTLAILATFRLTHLLAFEDGPADLLARTRARLGDSFLGRLMDCFYCLSLWIAAPMALVITGPSLSWPLAWLALSGGACVLLRATEARVIERPTSRVQREGAVDVLLWREARQPGGSVSPPGAGAGHVFIEPILDRAVAHRSG